jgi:hypothetical protein
MSQSQYQLVDLLEVYHARTVQSALLREVRRLRAEENCLPGSDRLRREEVSAFYESMLMTSTQLLQVLGDYDD